MFTRQHRAAVSLVVALSIAPVLGPALGPAVGPSLENTSWAESASAPAEANLEARAKLAYTRGAELYKARQFTDAAAAFEEGNGFKPHYAFLWNLALTYHALGDHQKTIEYYQRYLDSSPATATADRTAAQAAIVAEQRSLAAPTPAPTAPTAVAQSLGHGTDSADKPAESKVWRKWWFWTATGAAVVALGVGLGVGLAPTSTAPYREVTWK